MEKDESIRLAVDVAKALIQIGHLGLDNNKDSSPVKIIKVIKTLADGIREAAQDLSDPAD